MRRVVHLCSTLKNIYILTPIRKPKLRDTLEILHQDSSKILKSWRIRKEWDCHRPEEIWRDDELNARWYPWLDTRKRTLKEKLVKCDWSLEFGGKFMENGWNLNKVWG